MARDKLRYKRVISVGDHVTQQLLVSGITPWVAIYDCVERRQKRSCPKIASHREVAVENPRSTLTLGALKAIEEALREGNTSIRVIGEEDLLALPAALYAPIGAYIVYGMPGLAAVLIKVDYEHKRSAANLLRFFLPCPAKGKKE
ncbi:hypothetical protein PYJP_19770 [Pyrofollis japonicus]|uniref:DUF359 domain-containing protein n=1 Tax=Pyrofollis japonicus TaxID=3060460 RepID=UPI00295A77A4|nr:DUF359 domain-containing protein [Pyrofollis japonicus]BEP18625.1 hypothetical protein PYJP_19770 [Pyrofollis japonicus]